MSTNFLTINQSFGHLDHLPHYNGSGKGVGQYYVDQQLEPEFVKPGEPATIIFSIQDQDRKDIYYIVSMIEIYDTLSGERLAAFPWTNLKIGDFNVPYIFPKVGNYQIVLSILNEKSKNNNSNVLNTVPPSRTILYDNQGCDCERVVFNVSITESFGIVFTSVMYSAAIGVITVLGGVLIWILISRRKSKDHPITNDEFIRYSIMFLALGASVIHLAVYPEHGALRLEYSIFLLSASGAQLFYGISYMILTFSDDKSNRKKIHSITISRDHYKKSIILNLIGLSGSLVLILLYLYSITFPPPLSSNPYPEDVDLAGIIVKPLEILLVIGIVYLMRKEKRRYRLSITHDRK
ncbi:MAG: hypothetical protein R2685_02660 [Candidatus Nitrosocosmicus sp.]|nr:hypothetical protein [Candidatus Nitrosocosmicus sp.]